MNTRHNPYKEVNWDTCLVKKSMEHCHAERFDNILLSGFDILPFSDYSRRLPIDPVFPDDYYGSAPNYPKERWAWNPELPEGTMVLPNSEWVGIPGEGHTVALGSLAGVMGHGKNRFFDEPFPEWYVWAGALWDVANEETIPLDYETSYQYILDGIDNPNGGGKIGGLLYPDGGGVFRAHTRIPADVIRNLDNHDRFLGMAMYNAHLNTSPEPNLSYGYYLDEWDEVLKTGRRCFAFSEPDHFDTCYSRILLTEFTEYDVLKAYREGRFYIQMAWFQDSGLRFKKIENTGTQLIIETENATNGIKIVSDKGVIATSTSNNLTYTYPVKNGKIDLIYIRVEAYGDEGDRIAGYNKDGEPIYDVYGKGYIDEIYSQPIMFKNRQDLIEEDIEEDWMIVKIEVDNAKNITEIKEASQKLAQFKLVVLEVEDGELKQIYIDKVFQAEHLLVVKKRKIYLAAGIF